MNMKYQITPMRSEFLDKVRGKGLDDQNQAVELITASGGEPCRDVLRRAKEGEKLILASYCPFHIPGPYREYGPVFVLANPSDEYVDYSCLPLASDDESSMDSVYLNNQFVLKAYSSSGRILDAKLSLVESAESDLKDYLSNKEVNFVMARFAAYGCYALCVKRAVDC
ncbi:hypothetical protein MED121_05398 [Marinomonas sp. MED121]|nr:hypothetical protein MED121_05398 [Marinomonas sp. MED121]